MKTAMQQHIEHLKIMQNMVSEKSLDKELTETINTTLSGAIENAEHFIETEKQQIIDAYNSSSLETDKDIEGHHYYDIKFKDKNTLMGTQQTKKL